MTPLNAGLMDTKELSYHGAMTNKPSKTTASVGVTEHGNAAVLVTVTSGGRLLDRRRIELTTGLSTHPYHHEGAWAVGRYRNSSWSKDTSLDEAIALVKKVQEAANRGAREGLKELATSITMPITRIAIRECPELPPTIEECIKDNRAQTIADSVMYRNALADAAVARDWTVYWYDKKSVFDKAAQALGIDDAAPLLMEMGKPIGPPWQAKQKLAAAAAIASEGLTTN